MKITVKRRVTAHIGRVAWKMDAGVHEVPDHVGRVLVDAGHATPVEPEEAPSPPVPVVVDAVAHAAAQVGAHQVTMRAGLATIRKALVAAGASASAVGAVGVWLEVGLIVLIAVMAVTAVLTGSATWRVPNAQEVR